ncbi:MAG TPA: EAL domain-containing protein [Acidimicrobiales bacterium]|nr:EAL domain-containing protein [Acidimicrobiales bacterium]
MGLAETGQAPGEATGVPLWGVGFGVPACALLAVAQRYGYVERVPLLLILGELLGTLAALALFTSRFPPGTDRALPRVHMFGQIALVGTIVYTLGWGPLLAVGFIFPVANIMSKDGSRYGPWAMLCVAVTVAVGETLVAAGWVRTLVSGSIGHGLALLEVAGTCAVIGILTYNQKEKERIERATAESEQRFRALVQHASDVIIVVGPEGAISYVSPAFEAVLGYPPEESIGMEASRLLADGERDLLTTVLGPALSDTRPERAELRLRAADGSWRWCEVTVTNLLDAPAVTGIVVNLRDITERKDAESSRQAISDRLAFEAAHDTMTGLSNRPRFTERVTTALRGASAPLAVLFIDLDHFKLVNDGLGHAAGDELLVQAAQRLRSVIRPGDVLARFGGDEFVVLCEHLTGRDGAAQVADRLLSALAQPMIVAGDEVFVTASIGIALAGAGATAESLLRQADAAMYQAKHDGRGRIVAYEPELHGTAAAVLKTGSDLHRALERDELVLHYQPIVDVGSDRIRGFEALLRWEHPQRGLLGPAAFLGLAEETGLIVPIGHWVLETACHQLATWERARLGSPPAPPLVVNVNVAARQLADPALAATVAGVVADAGIAPAALCLELTENTLMFDTPSTIEMLLALRNQGIRLSIDDFGTGYSSLSYLKRFPVESLKIDRSFIDGLGEDAEDTSIVETIVKLAHSLGVATVAEGVETPVQMEVVRALGCDFAQGYLLGRPVPAAALGSCPVDARASWQALSPA